jgi:F-type H+-transporting ATPase subunit b
MMLGAHLSPLVAFLVQIVNFAILVGILVYALKKPLKGYLIKRHEAVKERIEESERLLKEAAELKATYEGRLSAVEGEIEVFRATAKAEMEKEKAKILNEAQNLASRIREQARLAYEQEMKEAMAKVRAEVSERTIKAAEAAVRDTFKKEDHDRMVEEFIQNVRSVN